jgi:hypothetical protein
MNVSCFWTTAYFSHISFSWCPRPNKVWGLPLGFWGPKHISFDGRWRHHNLASLCPKDASMGLTRGHKRQRQHLLNGLFARSPAPEGRTHLCILWLTHSISHAQARARSHRRVEDRRPLRVIHRHRTHIVLPFLHISILLTRHRSPGVRIGERPHTNAPRLH